MKWVALVISIFLTESCISYPTIISKESIVLGQSKEEIDHYFSKQKNDRGYWKGMFVKEKLVGGKVETTFNYKWQGTTFFVRSSGYVAHELTFLDNHLVSHALKAPPKTKMSTSPSGSTQQKTEMDLLCKEAISRNDEGGIFVHC